MKAADIFAPQKVDQVLGKIKEEVAKFQPDMSTKKGRDEIASMAYKVSRSKTYLDKLGKDLGEEARQKIEAINEERRKIVHELDALRDEVRKPLDAWEEKEKSRLVGHETEIQAIKQLGTETEIGWKVLDLTSLREKLDFLNSYSRQWEEFESRALEILEVAKFKASKAIDERVKYDAELAEAARLAKEAEDKARAEREETIAREAAEKAKKEAEEFAAFEKAEIERKNKEASDKAKAESERIEQERLREKARAEASEAARIKAEENARLAEIRAAEEKKAAVAAEKKRIEAENAAKLAAEKAEIEKREANKRHVAAIHTKAMNALTSALNIEESLAKEIVIQIAKGNIPNVKVIY